jgi:hypothetical protein
MTISETPLALSLRQRLLNLARARGEDYQDLLRRYGLERWLFRLSQSPYQQQFILKGALLFALWEDVPGRPTHDLVLQGFGEVSVLRMEEMVRQVCAIPAAEDGLTWVQESIAAEVRREDEHYPGLLVKVQGHLGALSLTIISSTRQSKSRLKKRRSFDTMNRTHNLASGKERSLYERICAAVAPVVSPGTSAASRRPWALYQNAG